MSIEKIVKDIRLSIIEMKLQKIAYAYPKLYAAMREYNASSNKDEWINQNS